MNYLISMVVDLQKKYVQPIPMPDVLMVPGESKAHAWAIKVLDGGVPAKLSGYTVSAKFERADGYMREIGGTLDGNTAIIVLDQYVYAIPGVLRGQFFISAADRKIALVEAYFNVRLDISGNIVLSIDEISYHPTEGLIVYHGSSFFDVSATSAVEGDVRDGKTFFRADGKFAEGSADFSETITGVTVTETLISGEDYELTISGGA